MTTNQDGVSKREATAFEKWWDSPRGDAALILSAKSDNGGRIFGNEVWNAALQAACEVMDENELGFYAMCRAKTRIRSLMSEKEGVSEKEGG